MLNRWSQLAMLLGTLSIASTGCSGTEPFPELHPLTGTVVRNGQPVTSGGLIFLPDPSNTLELDINASVNPDGTFTVNSSRSKPDGGIDLKPGAPAGRYRVVYHPPSDGSKMGLEVEFEERVTVEAKANTAKIVLPGVIPTWDRVPRDDAREIDVKKSGE